jgi:hypothetical protein
MARMNRWDPHELRTEEHSFFATVCIIIIFFMAVFVFVYGLVKLGQTIGGTDGEEPTANPGHTITAISRKLGADTTLDLPQHEKLVNVNWEKDSMWYLTRPMTDSDTAETYIYRENSTLGAIQGSVKIIEHK